MSRIKILKKTNHKPKSRRILKKLVQDKLDDILRKISLESTSSKKIIRQRLIYRQLINFLKKEYFKISILDTCSYENLIDFCDDYHIQQKLNQAKTHIIHQPVINQDVGHIIDKSVLGWFSSKYSEIVITCDLNETKSTLIHEFSHFLYDYKFNNYTWDFIDSVNDEFESYFQELILEVENGLLSQDFLRVENITHIRQMFEKRFQETLYELFIYYLELKINNYCHQTNLLKKNICLHHYLDYCLENQNQIITIYFKDIYQQVNTHIYNLYSYYVNNSNNNTTHLEKITLEKENLNNYLQYCYCLVNKFSNLELKKKLLKCLEWTLKLKSKIFYQDTDFLNQFIKN